ncbi:related to PKH1 - ser/thr protein kinases [Melanopsichium pennsylvanicum]|uniref:non-specific serine/threonine protein kinase n=2 Tax=Melanopsichium pennsylvanicum TaxID=63383 RepID=A0AAJ4XSR1_9BASI|nr:related to PKH1-ser/thr protein kinases [Melanopsichium pennsylvanicum 4]SNX86408.1 related to PKH1 - ser/thr protein kinases [Melanopsichium pennsylvanicum]
MSDQPTSAVDQAASDQQENGFASPTPMDTGFQHPNSDDKYAANAPEGHPSAGPSASNSPMSAPTPLYAPAAPTSISATSSAAASRAGSIRSNAPPSSSASTTRIRKGLLSRAGSEAEDRISRAASAVHQLTTDDDDDDPMISDSAMPRRFASQKRGPSGIISNSRQSSQSSLSPTTWGQRPGAASQKPHSSASSIASGNRSGSGEASEGGRSIGSVSLGRAMSVSSVSSVNSTSSLEAVPFREAPLGNVRFGFGGGALRAGGRTTRNRPYGPLAMSIQPREEQSNASQACGQDATHAQDVSDGLTPNSYLAPPAGTEALTTSLSVSAPTSDRYKGVPKPASDAWMYRVGPGMRTNKPRMAPAAGPDSGEQLVEDESSSPAKRSREVLRQKFAKGAGRLGIKTNIVTGLGASPSDQSAVYNPLDSSEDELNLVPPSRTPLPRNSSYFSSAPHSASSAAGTTLHPSLTPVPADFRTSSVTNAPLFVPKYGEDLQSSRLTPDPLTPSASASNSQDVASLPPLSYTGGTRSISTDLSLYPVSGGPNDRVGLNYPRRRSSATQKPLFLRAESSNDALDRTASPGLLVHDSSAADAPAAEPSLFTLVTSGSSAQRTSQAYASLAAGNGTQVSPHLTPAEVVRMEAQAGIASLPDSPSEPSPVPASYSPALGDETATNRPLRDSSQCRLRRPSSGAGSEASPSLGPAAGPSRRPESLQRQRLWSNAKRPVILRARTSESSISRGRRSQSLDRKVSSPAPASPVEGPMLEGDYDRPGMHSKNTSSSTVSGNELSARPPPHVAVIPEDDGAVGGYIESPDRIQDSPRPPSEVDADQHMALSPPSAGSLSSLVHPAPGPRSASPASQLARSPETIRVGPARITDSIYGLSPGSISNLRSPRLQPSSGSIVPERSTTPSRTLPRGPNDFHFGETLGEGSYSTVLEAWDLLSGPSPKEAGVVDLNATSAAAAMVGSDSSRKRRRRIDLVGRKAYAIKVLDKVHILKQGKQKYVSIEKEALSRMIRHPGVVTLFWTFQDRESLYFVLELASKGELLTFIRKHGSFDLASARFYAAQLADTIDGMHRAGVVHRDVKPENILLDSHNRIKITDFGSAKIVHAVGKTETLAAREPPAANQPSRAASFVGTAEYVSPELLVEKAQPAGKPADWWAFGCVLFQMLAGRPPFKGVNEYQTLQKVKNREFAFPEGFPVDAQDLIDKVLVLDPVQRPSATEIKAHRFFSDIDFDQLWEMNMPEIKTGLVQPLPAQKQRGFGDTSELSFDEGFGSSDESQAYNGDTQSIDYQTRERPEDSCLSLDAASSTQPNDADDSDLSDVGSNDRAAGSGDNSLPKRQSGLQRLADGFQSRFTSNSAGPTSQGGSGLATQQGGSAAPRRKFSTMSIDAANQVVAPAASESKTDVGGQAAATGLRPFSRSMQAMNSSASANASPSSIGRVPQPAVSNGGSLASASPGGLQQSWAALLLPKELMLYSLPVAQKKTGTGKMFTKRRQLVLTDFPRLLCVKETAAALKVKSEVILAAPAKLGEADATTNHDTSGTAPIKAGAFEMLSGRQVSGQSDDEAEVDEVTAANVRSSQQTIPNLVTGLEYRGGRALTIRIANGRTFVYETLSGDASALVRSIQEARRSAI